MSPVSFIIYQFIEKGFSISLDYYLFPYLLEKEKKTTLRGIYLLNTLRTKEQF